MSQQQEQRVVVVTGGGRGIGRATAERLARDGFHVVVVDLDATNAAAAAAGIQSSGGSAEALSLDVTDRAAVRETFTELGERLGRIDAVVNAAMRVIYELIEDFDEAQIDTTFDIGFKAGVWTTQAALPFMRRRGEGSIVFFSSPAATRWVPKSAMYSAVKGAVSSLTWQLAGELGPEGIRVNGVIPGAVPTEGARAVVDEAGYEVRKKMNALGRLASADDIANGIAYLVSPEASYVNGHLLAVDGKLL